MNTQSAGIGTAALRSNTFAQQAVNPNGNIPEPTKRGGDTDSVEITQSNEDTIDNPRFNEIYKNVLKPMMVGLFGKNIDFGNHGLHGDEVPSQGINVKIGSRQVVVNPRDDGRMTVQIFMRGGIQRGTTSIAIEYDESYPEGGRLEPQDAQFWIDGAETTFRYYVDEETGNRHWNSDNQEIDSLPDVSLVNRSIKPENPLAGLFGVQPGESTEKIDTLRELAVALNIPLPDGSQE